MTHAPNTLIRGLWPLPGGNDRYLDTLNRILQWVASTKSVTEEELYQWLKDNYNVSDGTTAGYTRVVTTLGALEVKPGQIHLALTSFGRDVLEAEGQAKARLVVERFMKDYLGFPEVLAIYNRADSSIHVKEMVERLQPYFPRWTSANQYQYRASWLLSLGCLEQDRGSHYSITSFGRTIADQYPPRRDIDAEVPQPQKPTAVVITPKEVEERKVFPPAEQLDIVSRLATELAEAATDSQNPVRFEQVVAECFEFLGFAVDHLGASGETDVLVRANMGEESYVVVVDAKARGGGKVHDLNVYTLQDHQKQNRAKYAVVVAGDFAGGKVISHAKSLGIILMNVPIFTRWLQLHGQTPLNLHHYESMFTTPGLVTELPNAIDLAAESHMRWGSLLADMMELLRETYEMHGLNETLPRENLFYMLMTRLGGVRYNKEAVEQAIDLLAHPAVGAMLIQEDGINLAMDRTTLARTLRALADRMETVETETQAIA